MVVAAVLRLGTGWLQRWLLLHRWYTPDSRKAHVLGARVALQSRCCMCTGLHIVLGLSPTHNFYTHLHPFANLPIITHNRIPRALVFV